MTIILRLSLVFTALLLWTGCATGIPGFDYQKESNIPRFVPVPYNGGTLPGDFWDQVDKVEDRGDLTRSFYASWPLPFFVNKYHMTIPADRQSMTFRTYNMSTLGLPEVYVPLFFNTKAVTYKRGELEPLNEAKRSYNLFWASSSEKGEGVDGLSFDAGGVPLFFDSGKESGPNWHFNDYEKDLKNQFAADFTNTVWWLGPAWIDMESTTYETEGEVNSKFKGFSPFFIFKWPGILLWTDYSSETSYSYGGTDSTIGHGPLAGYLTWFENFKTSATGKDTWTKLFLGGILWFENGHKYPEDFAKSNWSGPLWGMIGTSTKSDTDKVTYRFNFLWIPIPYKTLERE